MWLVIYDVRKSNQIKQYKKENKNKKEHKQKQKIVREAKSKGGGDTPTKPILGVFFKN